MVAWPPVGQWMQWSLQVCVDAAMGVAGRIDEGSEAKLSQD